MTNKKKLISPFGKGVKTYYAWKYWKLFVEDLAKRKNFNEGMLKNLAILCELYQEYEDIKKRLKKEGTTYKTEGRYGFQYKTHPLVQQRKELLTQIRAYTKMLDLNPSKEYTQGESETPANGDPF